MANTPYDVIVVGGGNAAMCAALSAREQGIGIRYQTQALDINDAPLPGLYAAGELVGGLFYYNYPGSSGLMAGSVFGRIAGRSAAAHSAAQ